MSGRRKVGLALGAAAHVRRRLRRIVRKRREVRQAVIRNGSGRERDSGLLDAVVVGDQMRACV